MKKYNLYLSIICLFLLMLSCDPEICYTSYIFNETSHTITIKQYYNNPDIYGVNIVKISELSIVPTGMLNVVSCGRGAPSHSSLLSSVGYNRVDSIDLFFNDSIYLRYVKRGCCCETKNPLDGFCYKAIPNMLHKFAYHITNDDYLLALERYRQNK